MGRERQDDTGRTPARDAHEAETAPPGGDPNDALQAWERELREDSEHGLGREGEPDASRRR